MHIKPPTKTNITGTNGHLSLISLLINGLNSPVKRHKIIDWICIQDAAFFCIQETHLNNKDRLYQNKMLGKDLPSKWSQETSSS
jgi:exonuclease III